MAFWRGLLWTLPHPNSLLEHEEIWNLDFYRWKVSLILISVFPQQRPASIILLQTLHFYKIKKIRIFIQGRVFYEEIRYIRSAEEATLFHGFAFSGVRPISYKLKSSLAWRANCVGTWQLWTTNFFRLTRFNLGDFQIIILTSSTWKMNHKNLNIIVQWFTIKTS